MLACAVQSKRIFLKCVTKDTGQALLDFGKDLREEFLPCLLFGNPKILPPVIISLITFPG